jgi:hypothetical protein
MKYYASDDRLAVYRIDEDYNGYYINKTEKDWVPSQDALRVQFDSGDFDRISKEEAYAIIAGWKL